MTQPLALVLYERLLPGTQLVNRLQDLNYRVQSLNDPAKLIECAEELKPILVLADLNSTASNVCDAIARLKQNATTQHLPIIAFGAEQVHGLQAQAQQAGVTLLVSEAAILNHLAECLQQALEVD